MKTLEITILAKTVIALYFIGGVVGASAAETNEKLM